MSRVRIPSPAPTSSSSTHVVAGASSSCATVYDPSVQTVDQIAPDRDPVVWDALTQLDDPYPVYRRLRDEAPLYHDERADIWAFTRFDDVQAASKDWETYSSQV